MCIAIDRSIDRSIARSTGCDKFNFDYVCSRWSMVIIASDRASAVAACVCLMSSWSLTIETGNDVDDEQRSNYAVHNPAYAIDWLDWLDLSSSHPIPIIYLFTDFESTFRTTCRSELIPVYWTSQANVRWLVGLEQWTGSGIESHNERFRESKSRAGRMDWTFGYKMIDLIQIWLLQTRRGTQLV